ncbi:hypothetical protein [Pontiella sp.]|uniref:hypothetical protein n=1 Tax=Pontiella sp. TaxID=2837462 RepID=UPI003565C455
MRVKRSVGISLLVASSLCSVFGAEVRFTGPAGGNLAEPAHWSTGAYPAKDDFGIVNQTAALSVPVPNDVLGLRIGSAGTGLLNVGQGAVLEALAHSRWDTAIGSDGGDGTVNQAGGKVTINYLEIGRGEGSKGVYHLKAGELIICRGQEGYTLYLGTDRKKSAIGGMGSMVVSGGSLITRTGVCLGSENGEGIGQFWVQGSVCARIGIGSSGTGDGTWQQNPGSILKVDIDQGGVTKILVDHLGGEGTVATFEDGALLDVSFVGGRVSEGTWTVLEVENGQIIDKGLRFSPSVNPALWSFKVDNSGENGILTVSAAPTELGLISN